MINRKVRTMFPEWGGKQWKGKGYTVGFKVMATFKWSRGYMNAHCVTLCVFSMFINIHMYLPNIEFKKLKKKRYPLSVHKLSLPRIPLLPVLPGYLLYLPLSSNTFHWSPGESKYHLSLSLAHIPIYTPFFFLLFECKLIFTMFYLICWRHFASTSPHTMHFYDFLLFCVPSTWPIVDDQWKLNGPSPENRDMSV